MAGGNVKIKNCKGICKNPGTTGIFYKLNSKLSIMVKTFRIVQNDKFSGLGSCTDNLGAQVLRDSKRFSIQLAEYINPYKNYYFVSVLDLFFCKRYELNTMTGIIGSK